MSACPECDQLREQSRAAGQRASDLKGQLPAAQQRVKDAVAAATAQLDPLLQEVADDEAAYQSALAAAQAAKSALQAITGGPLVALGAAVASDVSVQPHPGWAKTDLGGGVTVWTRTPQAAVEAAKAAGALGAQMAYQQAEALRNQALDTLRDAYQREATLQASLEAGITHAEEALQRLQQEIADAEADQRRLWDEAVACDQACAAGGDRKPQALLVQIGSGLAVFGAVLLLLGRPFAPGTPAAAPTPSPTPAVAASPSPSPSPPAETTTLADSCRGIAHNRSSQFTDAQGTPLSSPSVILVGRSVDATDGSVVTVVLQGPTGNHTGTGRVTGSRVVVAVPIDTYGLWQPGTMTLATPSATTATLGFGSAWSGGGLLVGPTEAPCTIAMLRTGRPTTTPKPATSTQASSPATPSPGGGGSTGQNSGAGSTSSPTRTPLVAGGLLGLVLGGGLLGAGTLTKRPAEGGGSGSTTDEPVGSGEGPDEEPGTEPTDELTDREVFDELRKVDPALAERYVTQRLVEQRRERGEETEPPSVVYITLGTHASSHTPTSDAPGDAWVAGATMGDKWEATCNGAVRDPNLVTGLKAAVKQLADPTVIATMVGLGIVLGLIGMASAGVGYVVGLGLLVFFFGQQFFEFLDIVSEVNKAETKAALDAATRHMTEFLIKVGPDWILTLTTFGVSKIRKLFPSTRKPLPKKPGPITMAEEEATAARSAKPSEVPAKATRPLGEGGVHPSLPKTPPTPAAKTPFTMQHAKNLVIDAIRQFMHEPRIDKIVNRTVFRVLRRDKFLTILRKRFPNAKWSQEDLGAHVWGKMQEIFVKGTSGVATAIHEWVHAFSNRTFVKNLGLLNEGLTELFASEIAAAKGIKVTPNCAYVTEGWTKVAAKLQKLVGSGFLKTKYFGDNGAADFAAVGRAVNKATGNPNAWAALQQAAAAEDAGACLRILTPKAGP